MGPLLRTWHRAALLLAAAMMTVLAFAWVCHRDSSLDFLPTDQRAHWILFPAALDASTHNVASVDTIFRRRFTLDREPPAAQLAVRASRRLQLKINGKPVELAAPRNWKVVSTANIQPLLRAGENTIEARIFNDNGPPALWLALTTDQFTLQTDSAWTASLTGSAWRTAALASVPKFPGPGNLVTGTEKTWDALRRIWPVWIAFGVLALVIWAAARYGRAGAGDLSRREVIVLLALISVLWAILFWNNTRLLPFYGGFDSVAHVDYIKYIQQRCALPLPHEGFEMFQPPLYYVLSAGMLGLGGLSPEQPAGVAVLRVLTMLFGIAHFIISFLCLRLLFPGRVGAQLVGLAIAAFLPMQLYLAHYVTNETLAATLTGAALYASLRLLRTVQVSVRAYALLGFLLGLAMLAKTTAVLLMPPLFCALAAKEISRRSPISTLLRTVGLTIAVCLVTCGWHYGRIWWHFGTPFVGNWEAVSGFSWWQDPGYRMTADYLRFGRALTDPFFSGLAGFWDGIYSTLWGDALWGGLSDLASRTPWNYQLVASGFVLAIVPSLLILAGAAAALFQMVRKPSAEWFVLLGFSAMILCGVIFMTLKVPSYAQVKAFYGLAALVPLSCCAALGWEALTRSRKTVQFLVGGTLALWALNSFASVWIRDSAALHVYAGTKLVGNNQSADAPMAEALKAVQSDPSSEMAHRFLSLVMQAANRPGEAEVEARRAVELEPTNSATHLQLSVLLMKQGKSPAAIAEARQALELGPENSVAYAVLLTCLLEGYRDHEVIQTAPDALAVSPFTPEIHYAYGVAAARQKDFMTAADQFGYALLLRNDWAKAMVKLRAVLASMAATVDGQARLRQAAARAPDSPALLNEFAWLFATFPDVTLLDGPEAVRLAERVCSASQRNVPRFLVTLAASYAEASRFPEAIRTAEEARALAESSGDSSGARKSEKLLRLFRINQPYREEPTPPGRQP